MNVVGEYFQGQTQRLQFRNALIHFIIRFDAPVAGAQSGPGLGFVLRGRVRLEAVGGQEGLFGRQQRGC